MSCAICQLDFQADEIPFTTPCNHKFHASCIAEAWRFDPRCPTCRDCPNTINATQRFESNDSEYSESNDEDEDEEHALTYREAFSIGKCMKITNPAMKRSFATLTKWNKLKKESLLSLKPAVRMLRALEDDIEERTQCYHDRLTQIHKRKNRKLIENEALQRKQLQRAKTNIWATKLRIAKKCGYETLTDRIRRIRREGEEERERM